MYSYDRIITHKQKNSLSVENKLDHINIGVLCSLTRMGPEREIFKLCGTVLKSPVLQSEGNSILEPLRIVDILQLEISSSTSRFLRKPNALPLS